MVAEAEVVCQQNVGVLDVKHFPNKGSDVHEIGEVEANSPPSFDRVRVTELVSAELLTSQQDVKSADRSQMLLLNLRFCSLYLPSIQVVLLTSGHGDTWKMNI